MADPQRAVAKGLADAFLAGEWEPAAMGRRGQQALGQRRAWIRNLAVVAWHAFQVAPLDAPAELSDVLLATGPLQEAFARGRRRSEPPPRVRRWFFARTGMGAAPWPVAPLGSIEELQDLLGLRLGKLLWLADCRRMERTVAEERLRHYRYRWVVKRSGGFRLIEEPKPLLKHIQRVLAREILDRIPAHEAVHGFRQGRSALTYASCHAGQATVIHLDLEDFFGTVTAGRVYGIFRACGYPEPVAHVLSGLCTNSTPPTLWAEGPRSVSGLSGQTRHRLGRHLDAPHLPQGSPASPALANLSAYRLDCRLAGLARTAGLTYSRYADDLALSSRSHLSRDRVSRLLVLVEQIATEEGFRLNRSKTFVQRSSQRQRLAGLVVNDRPNVDRREYDQLKAILHNAARYGPHSQNRDGHPNYRAHLLGRISYVRYLHPARGDRLLAAFNQIDWAPQTAGA